MPNAKGDKLANMKDHHLQETFIGGEKKANAELEEKEVTLRGRCHV